ncbi:MAG: hypothetical protein ABIO70_15620 [Pseudomonadota bacterium]
MTLQAAAIEALVQAGLASAPPGLCWRGRRLDLEVMPSGRVVLSLPAVEEPRPMDAAARLLASNPTTGWCWALGPAGLARRLVLDPRAWMDAHGCAARLEALVDAQPSSVPAAAQETLLPLVAAAEVGDPRTEEAIAHLLLIWDGTAVDGCRHRLAEGQAPTEAVLAGPDARALQRRLGEERPALAAVLQRPDLSPFIPDIWPLDPSRRRTP